MGRNGEGGLWLGPDGATLHTNAEMAVALGVAAPWLRVSVVPEAGVPTHAPRWPEGIGALTVEGVIWALASGGPAEAAGLKIGDRIGALDGQVDGPVGTPVRLRVSRAGLAEPFEVTVVRDKVSGTIRSFPVGAVYEARDGKMWFGLSSLSDAVGIVRYDVAEKEVRLFTEADGLEIDSRPHLVQTQDGTLWTVFGSARAGVSRFDGRSWTSSRLSAFGGTDINPSVLETRDGTLWVGGFGTLHAFRDGKWTVYRRPDTPLPNVRIWDLIEASDGALWMVSRGHEAYRLDRGSTQWTSYEGLVAQCETPDGTQWFTSQKGEVIRYDGQTWTRYGREDGGLDFVWRLIAARDGTLWAAGSHGIPGGQPTNAFSELREATAATARFDGHRWSLETHPRLDWMVHPRAVFESRDGDLWFGASSNQNPERGHRGGILRFDGKAWTHYEPPDAPSSSYGIGQTAEGTLWSGGTRGLARFGGQTWTTVTEPAELAASVSDAVYSTPGGDL